MPGTFITQLLGSLFAVLSVFGSYSHSALSSLASAIEPSDLVATSKYPPPAALWRSGFFYTYLRSYA